MSEGQKDQLAMLLGLFVGTGLDLGFTPTQLVKAFSRKNVLAAVEIMKKKDSHE